VSDPATAPGGGAPALRLPDPGRLFESRAARLAALARGHAAPEWLLLLSRVAAGQASAVREIRARAPLPLPPAGAGPPLAAAAELGRDGAWRRMLAIIVAASRAPGLPAETEDALRRLAAAREDELEALAGAVLAGAPPPGRLACAPFVGAALQAWLAGLAAALAPASVPAGPVEACPACGAPPVAGRIRAGDRLRFVTCALCATEWNVPRVRCVACDTSAGPEYFHVEPEAGAKAEACPTCRSYLKLFDEERRPGADPAADDAATLALDLLLAEAGYHRAGPNLYVGFGAER
jgi:FdhE protein